jgi:hypothetical protein
MDQRRRPGLTEALIVWALFAAVALAVFITYWRIPPEELYHTTGTGPEAGASRVLVSLGYPFSLVAIALAVIAAARLGSRPAWAAAVVAIALCATIGIPGVIDQGDLDARPINGLAGAGVGIALALTILALVRTGRGSPRPFSRSDSLRVAGIVALALAALPWIWAELGFYITDTPVLGRIFWAKQIAPSPGGEPSLHAVHLGRHHGMDGVLLATSALILSRVPRDMPSRRQMLGLGAFLSLMLVYGLANALQDFWTEQLVKRGTVSVTIPSLIRPAVSWAWAAILLAALLIHLGLSRVARVNRPTPQEEVGP